eukprot:1381642-Amphidinium_carterae.4
MHAAPRVCPLQQPWYALLLTLVQAWTSSSNRVCGHLPSLRSALQAWNHYLFACRKQVLSLVGRSLAEGCWTPRCTRQLRD